MTEFLTVDDLTPFAADIDSDKAEQMIADATALAVLAAPCLGDDDVELTDPQLAAVKAILRGAILRWDEAGTGAFQSEQTGPFGVTMDTRQPRRSMFWPTEITQLQAICAAEGAGGAFSVDTVGSCVISHADICAINFGATYCSCGAILSGYPLYEVN